MGYIESNLLPDEKIVYRARLHWIIFWKPCAIIACGIIFILLQPIVGMVVVAIGLLALIPHVIDYATSEFGVTKRVIIKVGFCGGEPWSCCCAMWKRSRWNKV